MNRHEIEETAKQLLVESDAYRIPVPVDMVAYRLGLLTEAAVLDDNTSGILLVDNNRGAIGYNSTHAPTRQRFTIAHEIGHFVLHVKGKDKQRRLFIDKYRVFFRDGQSSGGVDREEIEANSFGAALLMPKQLVLDELLKVDFDIDDDDLPSVLAKRFNVSPIAMSNRLNSLGLIQPE